MNHLLMIIRILELDYFILFKSINSCRVFVLPVLNILCLLRSTVWCDMRNRSILNVGGNNIF